MKNILIGAAIGGILGFLLCYKSCKECTNTETVLIDTIIEIQKEPYYVAAKDPEPVRVKAPSKPIQNPGKECSDSLIYITEACDSIRSEREYEFDLSDSLTDACLWIRTIGFLDSFNYERKVKPYRFRAEVEVKTKQKWQLLVEFGTEYYKPEGLRGFKFGAGFGNQDMLLFTDVDPIMKTIDFRAAYVIKTW